MLKKRYKWLLLIVGVWIFAMIATAPQMITSWKEKKIVEQTFKVYSAALVSNEFENAYLYCGKEFRSAASHQDFVKNQQEFHSRLGNLKSVHEKGIVVTVRRSPPQRTAVIDADFEYDSKTVRFKYEFHYEDGRWLLYGYKEL